MAKYRKKASVVEAVQWFPLGHPDNKEDMPALREAATYFHGYKGGVVATDVGNLVVPPGAYIVTNSNGRKGICTQDTFEETYELVKS